MSAVTTHVLDTSRGLPAVGVPVVLERRVAPDEWREVRRGETDADGRVRSLLPAGSPLVAGTYRLTFDTRRYFDAQGTATFYPSVIVVFDAAATETHYHVPLLLSPFGYSTYRGT